MTRKFVRILTLAVLSLATLPGSEVQNLGAGQLVLNSGKTANCDRIELELVEGFLYTLTCFAKSPPREDLVEIGSKDLFFQDILFLDLVVKPSLPSSAPSPRTLTRNRTFAAAANLYSATGDFNGDGLKDYATPPTSGKAFILRTGRPGKTFGPERLIPVGGDPRTVISADFNADGLPDFAVGHFGGISLVYATASDTYAPSRELPAGGRVESLFQADFNNDKLPDLAAVLYDGKTLLVFLNTGGGNFAAPIRIALPEEGNFVVAGDVNGDGRPDLVLTTRANSPRNLLMAALNNGNGTFSSVLTSPLPEVPAYLAVTDTNGDNKLDAIVRLSNGLVSMHSGNGAGTFTRTSVHSGGFGFTTGFDIVELDAANRFMAYPGRGGATLVADRIQPNGTLGSLAAIGFPGFAQTARVADLNGDSQPDLIAAGDGGFGRTGGLWVSLRSGQSYAPATTIGNIKANAIEVVDLNGDNRPDIVALNSTNGTCSVLINTGNGNFAPPVIVWDQSNTATGSYSLLVGDVNNDKRPEIIIRGDNTIFTMVNTGNGSFRPAASIAVPIGVFNVILGDINRDGLDDLLVMTGNSRDIRNNGTKPVLVQYLSQPDASFRPPTNVLTVSSAAVSTILAFTDLNNDKIPDIVYGSSPDLSASSVRIQLGQPGGGYKEATVFVGPDNLLFRDVDGDGTVDAVNASAAGDLAFYRGRGDGSFGRPLVIPGGGRLIDANLNNDNKVDFLALVSGAESFVLPIPSNFPPQTNATVISAASVEITTAAPDSIVSIYGTGLATTTLSTPSADWPTALGGTTATVRDLEGVTYPARLAFVSPGQVNLLIPPEVNATGTASVQITSSTGALSTGPIPMNFIAPSLFIAGPGLAAANILRVRGTTQTVESIVTVENGQLVPVPIDLGPEGDQVYLLLFGTGIRNRQALGFVRATIGGVNAPVLFAGAQGQFPGVDQVNVQIPRSLAGRGLVDLVLSVVSINANSVKIAIR